METNTASQQWKQHLRVLIKPLLRKISLIRAGIWEPLGKIFPSLLHVFLIRLMTPAKQEGSCGREFPVDVNRARNKTQLSMHVTTCLSFKSKLVDHCSVIRHLCR